VSLILSVCCRLIILFSICCLDVLGFAFCICVISCCTVSGFAVSTARIICWSSSSCASAFLGILVLWLLLAFLRVACVGLFVVGF